jgi:hypothetical protein
METEGPGFKEEPGERGGERGEGERGGVTSAEGTDVGVEGVFFSDRVFTGVN